MATNPTTLELAVSGLTCGSCVRHVGEALRGLEGVERAEVSLEQRRARARIAYDSDRATPGQMIAAIEEAGYGAKVRDTCVPEALPVRGGCGCSGWA